MSDLLMSHGEAVIVKTTFQGMVRAGKGPEFAKAFYAHLFTSAPEIRAWFPKDMVEQNRKLVRTLGLLLQHLPDWRDLVGPVREQAPQHAPFPISAHHFEVFADSLLKAMEETTGAKIALDVAIPLRMALLRIGAEMTRPARASS